jgi:hypothetical protein
MVVHVGHSGAVFAVYSMTDWHPKNVSDAQAMQDAMLELQRQQLLPLMRAGFVCSADCIDRAGDDELQAW